jgi:hypothetical protein
MRGKIRKLRKGIRGLIKLLTDYLVRPDPSAAVFEAKSVRAKAEVDSCDHWNVEEEVSAALDICCCCPTAVKVKKYSLTPLHFLY